MNLFAISGVATLGPTGALAPPSIFYCITCTVYTAIHIHILYLYLYINCKYLAVKVYPLVSLAVGL